MAIDARGALPTHIPVPSRSPRDSTLVLQQPTPGFRTSRSGSSPCVERLERTAERLSLGSKDFRSEIHQIWQEEKDSDARKSIAKSPERSDKRKRGVAISTRDPHTLLNSETMDSSSGAPQTGVAPVHGLSKSVGFASPTTNDDHTASKTCQAEPSSFPELTGSGAILLEDKTSSLRILGPLRGLQVPSSVPSTKYSPDTAGNTSSVSKQPVGNFKESYVKANMQPPKCTPTSNLDSENAPTPPSSTSTPSITSRTSFGFGSVNIFSKHNATAVLVGASKSNLIRDNPVPTEKPDPFQPGNLPFEQVAKNPTTSVTPKSTTPKESVTSFGFTPLEAQSRRPVKKNMVYYPAPVPMKLNLPPRLSKQQLATESKQGRSPGFRKFDVKHGSAVATLDSFLDASISSAVRNLNTDVTNPTMDQQAQPRSALTRTEASRMSMFLPNSVVADGVRSLSKMNNRMSMFEFDTAESELFANSPETKTGGALVKAKTMEASTDAPCEYLLTRRLFDIPSNDAGHDRSSKLFEELDYRRHKHRQSFHENQLVASSTAPNGNPSAAPPAANRTDLHADQKNEKGFSPSKPRNRLQKRNTNVPGAGPQAEVSSSTEPAATAFAEDHTQHTQMRNRSQSLLQDDLWLPKRPNLSHAPKSAPLLPRLDTDLPQSSELRSPTLPVLSAVNQSGPTIPQRATSATSVSSLSSLPPSTANTRPPRLPSLPPSSWQTRTGPLQPHQRSTSQTSQISIASFAKPLPPLPKETPSPTRAYDFDSENISTNNDAMPSLFCSPLFTSPAQLNYAVADRPRPVARASSVGSCVVGSLSNANLTMTSSPTAYQSPGLRNQRFAEPVESPRSAGNSFPQLEYRALTTLSPAHVNEKAGLGLGLAQGADSAATSKADVGIERFAARSGQERSERRKTMMGL